MTNPIRVDHPGDARLDPIRAVVERRDGHGPIVIEGEIALARAIESGLPLDGIVTTPRKWSRLAVLAPRTQVLLVHESTLSAAMGFDFHRGCVGFGPRPESVGDTLPAHLEDALKTAWRTDPSRVVVVAERLADPSNIGAIARNARAFGVPLLICDASGADPWSRRSVRASMGNIFTLPTIVAEDPLALAKNLRTSLDAELVAATVGDDAIDVRAVASVQRPRVLFVGNEGDGLARPTVASCDLEVTIPMDVQTDSLNVAAATAVLLFALRPSRSGS